MNVSNGFWVIVGVLMHSQSNSTWCEELTHLKRPWCWERLRAGGEGDDRGWDGWMAPPARWTWVWVDSGSWWRTGRPGVLWFMGSHRIGHDWATELNWWNSKSLEPGNWRSVSTLRVILTSPFLPHPVSSSSASLTCFTVKIFSACLLSVRPLCCRSPRPVLLLWKPSLLSQLPSLPPGVVYSPNRGQSEPLKKNF